MKPKLSRGKSVRCADGKVFSVWFCDGDDALADGWTPTQAYARWLTKRGSPWYMTPVYEL